MKLRAAMRHRPANRGKDLSKKAVSHSNHEADGAFPFRFKIVCSWCGTLIRSGTQAEGEQMCLICHARLLNDYFQKIRKLNGGGRTGSRRRL